MSISNGSPENIPFLDLVTPHLELEQELTGVFRQALLTAGFIGGPMVEEFEKAFAAFCGTSYSIAISSGTDALRFAIMASGVQPGDVVVDRATIRSSPQQKPSRKPELFRSSSTLTSTPTTYRLRCCSSSWKSSARGINQASSSASGAGGR